MDKLIKSVIDRLDKLENSLKSIIAVQLKEAISLINSKIENLDTKIDNMEAKLNQRWNEELAGIKINMKREFEAQNERISVMDMRINTEANKDLHRTTVY